MKKYEIVGLIVKDNEPCHIVVNGIGKIDLKTIDDDMAQKLIEKKVPWLRLKESASVVTTPKKQES